MAYTTIPKSSLHFTPELYVGTGSSRTISTLNFQPDWVWIKNRGTNDRHSLFDAVRAAPNMLTSNANEAQSAQPSELTAFNANGFTVNNATSVNGSSANYVSWNWKANGVGSANTDGSITSTVSTNTTSGFSIVKYTGTGNGGVNTVGHGLGVIPKVIIIKALTTTQGWYQYHESLGNTKVIDFTTAAAVTNDYWSDTTPTASVFNVIGNTVVGGNYDYIAYCFAEKQGYSKFGSYTGNGNADGTFTYLGFKPAFIMIKKNSGSSDWAMFDNKRQGYNVANNLLYPNNTTSDTTGTFLDLVSNGFKMRTTATWSNASGASYIYMAFAEAPLVSTNGNAATAR